MIGRKPYVSCLSRFFSGLSCFVGEGRGTSGETARGSLLETSSTGAVALFTASLSSALTVSGLLENDLPTTHDDFMYQGLPFYDGLISFLDQCFRKFADKPSKLIRRFWNGRKPYCHNFTIRNTGSVPRTTTNSTRRAHVHSPCVGKSCHKAVAEQCVAYPLRLSPCAEHGHQPEYGDKVIDGYLRVQNLLLYLPLG